MFSYTAIKTLLRTDKPLSVIRDLTDETLAGRWHGCQARLPQPRADGEPLWLAVDACRAQANDHAEGVAALAMIDSHADRSGAITLSADQGYDTSDLVNELRSMNVSRTWRDA